MTVGRNIVNKIYYIRRFSAWTWLTFLISALVFVATPAKSAVTFSGTGPGNNAGETNSASVTFSLSISGTATNLLVTLTNLATYKPNDPSDILTAVFFSLAGDPN